MIIFIKLVYLSSEISANYWT